MRLLVTSGPKLANGIVGAGGVILRWDGASLHEQDGYRFAIYERRGGRWPELGTSEDREWLGRFLGRRGFKIWPGYLALLLWMTATAWSGGE